MKKDLNRAYYENITNMALSKKDKKNLSILIIMSIIYLLYTGAISYIILTKIITNLLIQGLLFIIAIIMAFILLRASQRKW